MLFASDLEMLSAVSVWYSPLLSSSGSMSDKPSTTLICLAFLFKFKHYFGWQCFLSRSPHSSRCSAARISCMPEFLFHWGLVSWARMQHVNNWMRDDMWDIPPLSMLAPVSPSTGRRGMGLLSLGEWKNMMYFVSLSWLFLSSTHWSGSGWGGISDIWNSFRKRRCCQLNDGYTPKSSCANTRWWSQWDAQSPRVGTNGCLMARRWFVASQSHKSDCTRARGSGPQMPLTWPNQEYTVYVSQRRL